MAYLPEAPAPQADLDDAAFWRNCAERKLRFQRCAACGAARHPPGPVCPKCQSTQVEWTDAPEIGEVFTFTIVHHPSHAAVKAAVPYNIMVVDYPELGHVRVVSNIVDAAPGEIRIGMKVRLVWEQQQGEWLPRYAKA